MRFQVRCKTFCGLQASLHARGSAPERGSDMEGAMKGWKMFGAAALTLAALAPEAAHAETPTERYVEVRTVLGFRIAPAVAQSLLPSGWHPIELAGPNQGSQPERHPDRADAT